jgi:hypothetical protein
MLKEREGKCSVCDNDTTFRNLGVGYLKTCSLICSLQDKDNKEKRSESRKGRTQSKDTINKRVNNTNQQLKELNRKNTMVDKYGVDNPMKLNKIKNKVSDRLKGIKRPRTDEWQQNIIESKRKNNTLSHSVETKDKIKNSINEYYEKNLDRDKYIVISNNVKHLSGWYNGLYFRSSLELSFLVNNFDKTFLSCEIKKYAVSYLVNGKIKSYYPDYTDGKLIYEIKPTGLLTFGHNQHKIKAAKEMFGEKYKIITEQESDYITKSIIKKLIIDGNVVLTKYSEEIFNRYKH